MKYDTIYHYYSVETFLNIIRNHTLRLSDLLKVIFSISLFR